jgi:hypothetical protein
MLSPGLIHVELARATAREIDRRHQRMRIEPRGGPPRKWRRPRV